MTPRKTVKRPRALTLAEQEAAFARALDPGRAMARDLIADEQARIEAALPGLTAAEREQVAAGCTLGERSRRLVEILARRQQAAEVAVVAAKAKARPRAKPAARAVVAEPVEWVWVSRGRLALLEAALGIVERLAAIKPIEVAAPIAAEPIDVDADDAKPIDVVTDDTPHLARILRAKRTHSRRPRNPARDDEKPAATRRTDRR